LKNCPIRLGRLPEILNAIQRGIFSFYPIQKNSIGGLNLTGPQESNTLEQGRRSSVLTVNGGGIIFHSADELHHLAHKGSEIYLMEETVK
jgi:hypothetical protein